MVLSMTVCVTLIAAVAAQNGRLAAQGKGQTLDEQASVYRLTMPNVKAATSAAEALAKAVADSPTLRDKVEFDTDEALDPQLAKFQAIPEAAAALKAAGISARDYVLTATAIIGASLLQLAVDANAKGAQDGLSPAMRENVAFLKAHQADVKTLWSTLQQLTPQ